MLRNWHIRKVFITCLTISLSLCMGYTQAFPADSIYKVIRQHHVSANTANWDSLKVVYDLHLRNATSQNDTIDAVVEVFAALDDVHSTMTVAGKTYGFYHPVSDSVYQILAPMMQAQQQQNNRVRDTILAGNIAYISIPGLIVWGEDIENYAQQIQTKLCALLAAEPAGLIVDLRLNGGGNMYPMLAGLWPILGNETVLYTALPNGNMQFEWKLKDGNLFAQDGLDPSLNSQITHVKPCIKKANTKIKVMVLVGPLTASSGQATAVAFVGRPNTLIIGQPTAEGYITANQYYTISPQVSLNMSSAYIADRDKVIYPRIFNPQLWVIGGDDFAHIEKDIKVQMAMIRILNY